MNNIFTGTYTRDGRIYDYSGVWVPHGMAISWKAIVRNADVVCRPSGTLSDGLTQEEILEVITRLIELNIVESLEAHENAAEKDLREAS
jgi:hypothetical protein